MSHDRANGDLGREIDDVTAGTTRDFSLGFDWCEIFFGNFFFCTSSLAFKFLHKEICPLATQVLSVATTRKILRFFLFGTEVEDGFESTNDTDSNESIEEIANTDEPLADEEWLKRYNEEVKQNEELERMLQKRLDGTEHVDSW